MTFIKTLRCDLNKTFVNLGFAGAAALTFLLCFTAPAYTDNTNQKMYSIFEALFSMDRKLIESHSEFAASSLSRMGMSGYVTMFLPIIVAFPFMVAFCTERNNGNIRFVIARTGKMRYYFSKFISCFLCGGIAVLIGISMFMIAMHMLFPPMSSYEMDPALYEIVTGGKSEFVLNFRYLFSNFLNGAIATMPAFLSPAFRLCSHISGKLFCQSSRQVLWIKWIRTLSTGLDPFTQARQGLCSTIQKALWSRA